MEEGVVFAGRVGRIQRSPPPDAYLRHGFISGFHPHLHFHCSLFPPRILRRTLGLSHARTTVPRSRNRRRATPFSSPRPPMAANKAPMASLGSDAAAAAAMATGTAAPNLTSKASSLEATGSASTSSIAAAAPKPPVAAAAEIITVDEEAQATTCQAGAEVDEVATEEDASGNWTPSTITMEQLKELEKDGLLPAGIWRSTENHPEPDP